MKPDLAQDFFSSYDWWKPDPMRPIIAYIIHPNEARNLSTARQLSYTHSPRGFPVTYKLIVEIECIRFHQMINVNQASHVANKV